MASDFGVPQPFAALIASKPAAEDGLTSGPMAWSYQPSESSQAMNTGLTIARRGLLYRFSTGYAPS